MHVKEVKYIAFLFAVTVKLLISARAAINFRCALDMAAIGGRRLLEVHN